jgi:heme exporter protein D
MDVGSGMIQGGWTYVWMAYGISWTVLGLYTLRVLRQRLRGEG